MNKVAGTFKIIENWKFIVVDRVTREVLEETEICNTVVNNGLNHVRNWMAGDSIDYPIAIAIGTDNTAVQNTDTALGTEVTRASATISKPENYKVRYTKTFEFGSGESYTIYEAGLFDNTVQSGSIMIARVIEAGGKAVDATVDLIVTCDITIARV